MCVPFAIRNDLGRASKKKQRYIGIASGTTLRVKRYMVS